VQETKRVSDTVRHEELREEHEGPVKDERLEETVRHTDIISLFKLAEFPVNCSNLSGG
jgi:hypothetical protein